ncbi:MAG: Mur ligase family protein [Bacteroidota bacterium]
MDIHALPDAHLRIFERPVVPPPTAIRDIYLIGICGTGMGSLAGLLKAAGHAVRGADQNVYPPMSTRLANDGITVFKGYNAAHLNPAPDLVIVGNACTPTHPEAAYARTHGLVQQSFPEALAHFFLANRRSLVIAGTHGKTSTTGLVTHMLEAAGKDPGFLVGGVMQGRDTSYQVGTGPHFVIEGDEYDSAYFDKQPKFLHYQPQSAIVTSMELDHTDIYANWEIYQAAFRKFAGLLPADGTLVLCGDHQPVAALAAHTNAKVVTYGLDNSNHVSAINLTSDNKGQHFTLTVADTPVAQLFLPMHGAHNLSNALGACALLLAEGIAPAAYAAGLATYQGMKRRQEVRAVINDIVIIDDFAHHPTAVKETIAAIKRGYPDRQIRAIFEPRSNTSRRKDFQDRYVAAFAEAHAVMISAPPFRHNDDVSNFMDVDVLIHDIRALGIEAAAYPDAEAILPDLVAQATAGDVVLVMSNGGFGGIHQALIDQLGEEKHEQ